MTNRIKLPAVISFGLLLCGECLGQTAPATFPSTAPATTRRAPWRLTLPAGFVKVEVADRMAICDPADEAWVKQALSAAPAATKPTTMPADLVARITSHRPALAKQLATDFGITDQAAIDKLFDDQLIPEITKLEGFHAPIYFMPVTQEKLKELVKGGWGSPKFYYNRVADDIAYVPAIVLSIEGMDDHVQPAIYKTDDSPEARQKLLRDSVTQMEANVQSRVAIQGQAVLQQQLMQFLDQKIFMPMQLKPGQEWLSVGLEGVHSARYVAMVNDSSVEMIMRFMTRDEPNNPFRGRTIDLLHLTPLTQLRPEFAPAYVDAMRRKSVGVVNDWLSSAPADTTTKVIAAVNQSKPADGEALLKVIKDACGADLSEAVKAK